MRSAGKRTTSRIVSLAREQHGEAVDAEADAARRGHAVLERREEGLVERLGLVVAGGGEARCCSKRARWSSGSLSSVKALAISIPPA